MSSEWEKTLPKALQVYIESQRQAARAAAIAELTLGKTELSKDLVKVSSPLAKLREGDAPKLDRKENSSLPRGVGRKYVAEYWRDISPSAVLSVTNVRDGIFEKTGAKISFQTVDRAMEQLAREGEIEQIEGTEGWRAKPKLRSVR